MNNVVSFENNKLQVFFNATGLSAFFLTTEWQKALCSESPYE